MKNTHHSCQTIVVHCIDFRFQTILTDWIYKKIGKDQFDRLSIAGGVKNLPYVIEQIEISYRLHHIKEIYLINHEDCGAYGEEGTYEKHQEDLGRARQMIRDHFPTLKIFLFYLKLDGQFVDVK